MIRIEIGMPQMAANGLSENWLFRYCGDLHWQELCKSMGVLSRDLTNDAGERLYATFVAIAARYSKPLAHVCENDEFDAAASIGRFGQSFFHGVAVLSNPAVELRLEMVTAFVARSRADANELRKSVPAAGLASNAAEMSEIPSLLQLSQAMRYDRIGQYSILDETLDLQAGSAGFFRDCEPSPYIDFNGANLLYFAAYPTLCDSLERLIINRSDLAIDSRDWALATSTIARDIYYLKNADIGVPLRAKLHGLHRRKGLIFLNTELLRLDDMMPIARVVTAKSLTDMP
jgi:probable biosynthetic protein (TIGR04098 family)